MAQRFFQHTLKNGLTLLAEKMPAMQSAAMTILLPAGAATDPPHGSGSSALLSDIVLRGAGERDSHQLTEYLDSLGLQRSASTSVYHARFDCAAVAQRVMDSIPVYADVIQRPHLPPDGFISARDSALQALAGLKDDPRQMLLVKLRECFLPAPLGRNPMGETADIKKYTLDACRRDWKKRYQAPGGIIAIAGNVDFARFKAAAEEHFGRMPGTTDVSLKLTWPPARVHHLKQKSEQTHIGIAFQSVSETDPDYYAVRCAMEAFGGGMSSRLFTEVREKRGLCYSVWAGHTGLKSIGAVLAYAGSSNDRAQATMDCILAEIYRLSSGITQSELDRAKIGLKAATIMQGESTSARCGAIAQDFFLRGRIRTLSEIEREIDQLTLDRVNGYLASHVPEAFTIVTVGPRPLKYRRAKP